MLVSIPQGTIKSRNEKRVHDLTDVSIPQGTIKRELEHNQRLIADLFQFHKVRLKVGYRRTRLTVQQKFQFHKVRLKELEDAAYLTKVLFQFHMVRLKED